MHLYHFLIIQLVLFVHCAVPEAFLNSSTSPMSSAQVSPKSCQYGDLDSVPTPIMAFLVGLSLEVKILM
jgi:hypothetical protein